MIDAFRQFLDSFKWRRGAGELEVMDRFGLLARKASEEAHAEVMVSGVLDPKCCHVHP
jgi:hypothetical protein